MENNFTDKFNTFINKYNTPRVFQILSTITFINLPILMFVLKVFRIYDAHSTAWLYGGSSTLRYINIFEIFLWNFGTFAESLAKFIVVVAAIVGIVFIWLNRPKIAGVCGGSLLLIMLLSLLRNWDFEHYYSIKHYSDYTFYGVSVQSTYYFLWGSLALLAVFVVLSIMYTKDGPRAKVVTVVQPVQQVQISAADEIKKLKDLCDLGVITQEEFDAKKEQLLGLSGIEKNADAEDSKQTPKESVIIGGNANATTLLKRAFMFLEDGEWSKADAFCEQVLNQEPENAQAYLGKLMAELRVRRQEDLANCEQPFNTSNNYQKAVRFGNEKFAGVLSGYIEHISERNENDVYSKAVSAMNGASSESAYKAAAETFKTISGYKDSDELAEQCLESAEICRKDAVYVSARSQMNGNSVNGYEAAIKTFSTISGWKNADELISECKSKIDDIKAKEEAERHAREQQAKKTAKKLKRIIVITATIVVACIVFVIVLINVIIPKQKLNKAMRLMDSGDYDAAYALLDELGNSEAIASNKHDRAMALIASGDYDAAYALLDEIGNRDAINSSKYDRAMALIASGDYDTALLLLEGLNYKDSADKVAECKFQKLKAALTTYKVGDTFEFGNYSWLILDIKDNRMLIISEEAVANMPYNETSMSNMTWEKCTLRTWLNETFYQFFSPAEQKLIVTTTITPDVDPDWGVYPGNNTEDKVFLLSITEFKRYFSEGEEKSKCKYYGSDCAWWLRNTGLYIKDGTYKYSDCAASIVSDGYLIPVNPVNEYNYNHVKYGKILRVARPAMWINIGT